MDNEPLDQIKEPGGNLPVDALAKSQQKDFISSAKRKRREENAKHWGFITLIWIIVACVGVAFIFKVWHLLAPASMCEQQIYHNRI